MGNTYRTLLVIGDNPTEIAAKYSADRKVGEYQRYELNQAPKLHREYLEAVEQSIEAAKTLENSEALVRRYQDLYDEYSEMDDFEFFQALTAGCGYDEDGNAMSDENPDAHYQHEKCYDDRVRKDQSFEAPFSDPLILKDGTKAYSATVGEVDWPKMHMYKAPIYRAVWEICVEGRKPETEDEKTAYDVMHRRQDYFRLFGNKDEYVGHCSAFWTYAVATEDSYCECSGRDIDWTNGFYDRFIKPLKDTDTVSVFEIKLLD